jgi:hypothetical protein
VGRSGEYGRAGGRLAAKASSLFLLHHQPPPEQPHRAIDVPITTIHLACENVFTAVPLKSVLKCGVVGESEHAGFARWRLILEAFRVWPVLGRGHVL